MAESPLQLIPSEIDTDLRLHIRRIVIWRLSAKVHLALFVTINIFLLALNLTSNSQYLWWLWVLTGWGFVISLHLFYVLTRGRVTFFRWHIFLYIMTNLYLLFIDYYSDQRITWCWIPWLAWTILIVVNTVIKRDVSHTIEPLIIFAVIISDTDGKMLIQIEQRPQFLAQELNMSEASIELIPMFINAMLQFSKEINMLDCNDFRLQGKKMKVVCYAESELICTGFISSESNSNTAREIIRRILSDFKKKYPTEIQMFRKVGLATPFESYKIDVQKIIELPLVASGKRSEQSD